MASQRYRMLTLLILAHLAILVAFRIWTAIPAPASVFFASAIYSGAVGVGISQLYLIALWAVCTRGPVLLRLAWVWFLATLMWSAMVVNSPPFVAATGARTTTDASFALAVGILAGLIGAIGPLLILRRFFQWRMVFTDAAGTAPATPRRQFSLAQLMIFTTLIAFFP